MTEPSTTPNANEKDSRGVIDKILGKLSSRKLLVFLVASVALFLRILPADLWTYIAIAYIGSQAVVDIFAQAGGVKRTATAAAVGSLYNSVTPAVIASSSPAASLVPAAPKAVEFSPAPVKESTFTPSPLVITDLNTKF